MLTKRTMILFDQDMWNILVALSREHTISVGELVRTAVRTTYNDTQRAMKIKHAVDTIAAFRKKDGRILSRGEESTILIRRMRNE